MSSPWSGGTAAFGSVMDDLIWGVTELSIDHMSPTIRDWSHPIALGCVPWMNHEKMIARLASLGGCCIVMNKGANDLKGATVLHTTGKPIITEHIPGLRELGRLTNGSPPIIGPDGTSGDLIAELGPVRLAGSRVGGRTAPILHAKMLLLGDAWSRETNESDSSHMHYGFTPRRAWLGSANWTRGSAENLEFGLWVDDKDLLQRILEFLCDVIKFSEPLGTKHAPPTPELVEAVWDNDAFVAYMEDVQREIVQDQMEMDATNEDMASSEDSDFLE